MARHKSASARRASTQARWAVLKILFVACAILAFAAIYILVASSRRDLDSLTLCPAEPITHTVLLVDVTDPMNVAQRQDFFNELEGLKNSIPRYGRLSVMKVDSAADRLLSPVIIRCNPGTAADVSDWYGNPKAVQEQRTKDFDEPLDKAFDTLARASGARSSPILESIQSVALTELHVPPDKSQPSRLIIASDLLQNTPDLNFYGALPDDVALLASPAFRKVRTDLRGVEVELWMLQRTDSGETQPRALPDLWTRIIEEQGGTVERIYRVSG